MTRAARFTLDTNTVNVRREVRDLNDLEALEKAGLVILDFTSVTDRELETDQTRFGPARRAKASSRSNLTARWVLGVSRLGIDTVLAGDDQPEVQDRIASIVFGARKASGLGVDRGRRDVMIIHTHVLSGNDALVTLDGDILQASDQLDRALGIRVLSPKQAVKWVRIRANRRTDDE